MISFSLGGCYHTDEWLMKYMHWGGKAHQSSLFSDAQSKALKIELDWHIIRRNFDHMLHPVFRVTAVAAIFLGTKQSSLLLPQPWSTHVLIGYVAWLASLRILLLIHKHFHLKRCKKGSINLTACKKKVHLKVISHANLTVFPWPTALGLNDRECILANQSSLLKWVGIIYKLCTLWCTPLCFILFNYSWLTMNYMNALHLN